VKAGIGRLQKIAKVGHGIAETEQQGKQKRTGDYKNDHESHHDAKAHSWFFDLFYPGDHSFGDRRHLIGN
tara:strand:- start:58 stop:267 length:210 start_codon:yes stop_codon:yes gene_type:complete